MSCEGRRRLKHIQGQLKFLQFQGTCLHFFETQFGAKGRLGFRASIETKNEQFEGVWSNLWPFKACIIFQGSIVFLEFEVVSVCFQQLFLNVVYKWCCSATIDTLHIIFKHVMNLLCAM